MGRLSFYTKLNLLNSLSTSAQLIVRNLSNSGSLTFRNLLVLFFRFIQSLKCAVVAPIFLVGIGVGLYYHDLAYVLWGMTIAVVVTLPASIMQLQALNGSGWIPPMWFLSLISKRNN